MISQIVFKIDTAVKARAMRRAKHDGVPFASFLKMVTKEFADGRFSIGIVDEIRPERLAILEKESKSMDAGKGMRLKSISAFRAYVRDL